MDEYFVKKFKEISSIPDIFELVKEIVWKVLSKSRAGLDLGLIELGNLPEGLIGAYYVAGSNMIVMNETPLKRITETDPKLLKPYIFSVLLHEYLHSLGGFDEEMAIKITFSVCLDVFGKDDVVTEISKDMKKFFPNIIYPQGAPQTNSPVKLIKDFDKSSTRYIG